MLIQIPKTFAMGYITYGTFSMEPLALLSTTNEKNPSFSSSYCQIFRPFFLDLCQVSVIQGKGPRKEEEESQRLFSSQPEVVKLRKRRYSQFSIHCRCIMVFIVLIL